MTNENIGVIPRFFVLDPVRIGYSSGDNGIGEEVRSIL